jgi:hypothetical protein
MNALVNDQLSRIRRLFGSQRASEVISRGREIPLRFTSYTGRTPYPGPRTNPRDRERIEPLFEQFLRGVGVRALGGVVSGEVTTERGRQPERRDDRQDPREHDLPAVAERESAEPAERARPRRRSDDGLARLCGHE